MPTQTALLSLENPVFMTYMLAASVMLLKLTLQPWMTVARMMKVRGGFRSPEDDFFCLRFGVWYPSFDCAVRTRFDTCPACRRCEATTWCSRRS